MNKMLGMALLLALVACVPENRTPIQGKAITFGTQEPLLSLQTKTSETSSLSSFKLVATTGATGSETARWSNVLFTRSGDVYYGGKLWPEQDPSFHSYAANVNLTPTASGAQVTATTATDVVCAYLPNPVYGENNILVFKHIFTRIAGVNILAESGYSLSQIQISLTPRTGGVYQLAAGAGHRDESGWSSVVTGADTVIASALGPNPDNLYLVPGMYTLQIGWSWQKGGGSLTAASRQLSLDLESGTSYSLSFVLGEEMAFGVDLDD